MIFLPDLPGSAPPGPTAPDLALTHPDPIMLAAVGQRLLEHGCTAELTDVGGCGGLDVRLLVRRADRPVTVEVLGPCDGAGRSDRWQAVRVDPDGVPCVWTGPARACPTEALVEFVDDLLGEDSGLLTRRYPAAG